MTDLRTRWLLPGLAALLLAGACSGPEPAPELAPTTPGATISSPQASRRTPTASPAPTPTQFEDDRFLARPPGPNLRVMTYNIGWDSIFPDGDPLNHDLRQADRRAAFGRIMRALQPDVICLQEINPERSSADLGPHLGQLVTGEASGVWQVVHVRDTLLASRLDLIERGYELETRTPLANLDQAAALLDLPDDDFGALDLYLICAHFKAGGGVADELLRIRQADAIMAHLRDFRSESADTGLPHGTPFVILGDFNIYDTDPARQLRTLIAGDIYNEGRYGEDRPPDWDDSSLQDAAARHNGVGEERYTWREDGSFFGPGALDRIFFSDSVLRPRNAFVLNTVTLADEVLERHGLARYDVMLDPTTDYYDHLPVVVDFSVDPLD